MENGSHTFLNNIFFFLLCLNVCFLLCVVFFLVTSFFLSFLFIDYHGMVDSMFNCKVRAICGWPALALFLWVLSFSISLYIYYSI